MMDAKARQDCKKEIDLLKVTYKLGTCIFSVYSRIRKTGGIFIEK
jgi:hypothetical protein